MLCLSASLNGNRRKKSKLQEVRDGYIMKAEKGRRENGTRGHFQASEHRRDKDFKS